MSLQIRLSLTAVLHLLAACLACSVMVAECSEVNLRFYGRVSSETKALKGGVSDFVITAESEEKARLWQAKFLSDLMLDGVAAKDCGDGRYRVPHGWMAAVRNGTTVHLLHAQEVAALASATESCHGEMRSSAVVPMAMDAFENSAFRFYYHYGVKPEGVTNYDETQDLDFCRDNGLGVVFWTGSHGADAAANVLSDGQWSYLLDYARRERIPVGLNFGLTEFPVRDHYPDGINSRQPGFMGGFVRFGTPRYGGAGHLSVDHPAGNAHSYEAVQKILRRYNAENVIGIHEANGELRHGDHNIFLNYGPEADRSFRGYLQTKYGSVEAYSKALYGENAAGRIKSWDEIRYPEVAEFAGYGPEAQDLSGTWRIKYTKEPCEADFAAGLPTGPDWAETPTMPGSDLQLFMKREPAVLKRVFSYTGEGRTWLYLWDLNKVHKAPVEIWLNGKLAKRENVLFNFYHWTYVEVTDLLKRGENTLALRLPWGIIGYKAYLTHKEPKFFPYASRRENRLWIDSVDWNTQRRLAAVSDSMNAMRAVDPDKSAVLMNPRYYSRQLREVARLRGGRFHDTGGMGACFEEALPMLMRGANLPFTLEPGGPAEDLPSFRRLMGLYMSEAVNAIHYFIHVGNVAWKPDIRAEFLRILPALKMLGKSRQDQGDVAMLIDSDSDKYFGYPWCASDFNISFPSGYWPWRFNTSLPDYPMDALVPEDFENGLADRYRVILDCNNTIVSKASEEAIRRWVEGGGTYVAMFQTGRHAETGADRWTLSSLTGFRGKVFARYDSEGGVEHKSIDVFMRTAAADGHLMVYEKKQGTGTALEKVADDAVVLATWQKSGAPAIGWRKIGKGSVYTFGVQLSAHAKGHGIWFADMVADIFRRRGVTRKGFGLIPGDRTAMRHFVSINGLYDVWYGWNADGKRSIPYAFSFEDGLERELTDVLTGRPLPMSGTIPPFGFVMATSPRPDTRDAAARWFNRQCGDNQGTLREAFSPPDDGYGERTLDLSDDWAVNGIAHQSLGLWQKGVVAGVTSNLNVAVKRFCVPPAWTNGTIYLSHTADYDTTCVKSSGKAGRGTGLRVFIDGKPLSERPADRGFSMRACKELTPGLEAELRMEIGATDFGRFTGTRGSTFLSFVPEPVSSRTLAGDWTGFADALATKGLSHNRLPGKVGSVFLRHCEQLPAPDARAKGCRVVFHMDNAASVHGVIVNGQYVSRHHHLYGPVLNLDVTPFLQSGENEFVLVTKGWEVEMPAPELHVVRRRSSR